MLFKRNYSRIKIAAWSVMLISCGSGNPTQQAAETSDSVKSPKGAIVMADKPDTFDVLLSKTDTSTLEGKRLYLKISLLKKLDPSGINYDTLIDLNYDANPDYLIAYYAQAGTGIKNEIDVYIYQKNKNNYEYHHMLSGIRNPSFYLKEKKITGFYLANGAGGGEMYRFIKNQWTITKEFYVDNKGDSSVWEIFYPQTNKMKKIIRPYAMIPPADILPTDYPEW